MPAAFSQRRKRRAMGDINMVPFIDVMLVLLIILMVTATAVAPGEHVVFHADRPFLYLITESSTGAVLFAGKYSGK